MFQRFSSHRFPQSAARSLWLASVGSIALTAAAAAKDLPATSDGAATIMSTLSAYVGKNVANSPALTVTPEGTDYLVSLDFAALMAGFKGVGINYEPAVMRLKVFAQDDGNWRIEQREMPTIKSSQVQNGKTIETSVTSTGVSRTIIVDSKLGWISSGLQSIDAMAVRMHSPNFDEALNGNGFKSTSAGSKLGDSGLTYQGSGTLDSADFAVAVDPKLAEPNKIAEAKPVNVNGKLGPVVADVKIDSETFRAWLDVWKFFVAHTDKADMAANEAALKTAVTAALAGKTALDEKFGTKLLTIEGPEGAITIQDAAVGIGLSVDGPNSRLEQRYAASSISLPAKLAPDNMRDLIPTSFDIGFKLTGFNLNAGATVAIDEMHLSPDGPPKLEKMDSGKALLRMLADGPVTLVVAPTHVVAPKLDLTLEGQGEYHLGAKATGKFVIHMRNFDQTVAAIKGLGEDQQKKLVPALAMAKGLGKAEGDMLSWVVEIGPDSTIKVNGLPLGKSPF